MGSACSSEPKLTPAQERKAKREQKRKDRDAQYEKEQAEQKAADRKRAEEFYMEEQFSKWKERRDGNLSLKECTPANVMPTDPEGWRWNIRLKVSDLRQRTEILVYNMFDEERGCHFFHHIPSTEAYTLYVKDLEETWRISNRYLSWVGNFAVPTDVQEGLVELFKVSYPDVVRKHFADHACVKEAGDPAALETRFKTFQQSLGPKMEAFTKEWQEVDRKFRDEAKHNFMSLSEAVVSKSGAFPVLPAANQAGAVAGQKVRLVAPRFLNPSYPFAPDEDDWPQGMYEITFSPGLKQAFQAFTEERNALRKQIADKIGIPLDELLCNNLPSGAICIGTVAQGTPGTGYVTVWEDTLDKRSRMSADDYRMWKLTRFGPSRIGPDGDTLQLQQRKSVRVPLVEVSDLGWQTDKAGLWAFQEC
jgi:hypothetical protein